MKTKLFIPFMIGLMILSACNSSKKSNGKGDISESVWGLVSIKSIATDSLLIAARDNTATLQVLSDGTVKGTAGCNSFEGQVAINGYNLKFGNIVKTNVVCPNATIENALYAVLDSVDNYTVDHGHLLLRKEQKVLVTFMSLNMR
jgi:heat shock protein HslJ